MKSEIQRIAWVVVLCSLRTTALLAQSFTLEQAMQSWRTLPVKRPANVNWGENGMPYEAAAHQSSGNYYATSEDGNYALEFTNRRRVWRYETRGDFYLVDLKTDNKRKLGEGLPEASLQFAKFSPNSEMVAYVSKNNIYVEKTLNVERLALSDVSIKKPQNRTTVQPYNLTIDGNDTIINGTFDWVYEEEFDCRDGFRWSSDSKSIAYWQSNTSGTGWFDIINNVDSIYPTVQHFPYPKAGTLNSAVRIGIVDVATAKTTWLDIPGNSRENYLPRMEFVPNTNTLLIQQMNRAQNINKVWQTTLGDELNLHLLCTDTDSAWVETNDNIHFLTGELITAKPQNRTTVKYFTFTSERDGWRHIYRVSADGKQWKCITDAPMDVVEEVALDETRGYLYFMATEPDHATERYLYRTKLYGNGKVEKIPTQDKPGQYSYDLSPTCDYAVQRYSNANTPPQYRILQMNKQGKWMVKEVQELNEEAAAKAKELGLNKEFVKVQSGDLMLDAWIIKPQGFDPTKKYPVIDYVYGEPASATVQDRWESSLFWQYLAQQGYVVVSIENRGANSPRGRQWRKCIYGEVGVAASEDQARGIQSLCRQFEWMDSTRIGITGWSGGGSQTLNCMFRYPDIFKTGVAIAFVSDQRLYDTIYQERYMNTPQQNPDGYFRGSPINFVSGLKGNLLLIHGTGDDNVHYQNCEMLVNRLIEAGKTFYQVSYPMRTHSISERPGTSLHLRRQLIDFFNKYL